MPENYDIRFTEDTYATKEEVASAFNVSNVDFIWNSIVSYRKRLTSTLELPDIDRTKLSLVFTHSLTNKILSYERMLNKAFYEYNSLTDYAKKSFKEKRLTKILAQVASASGSKPSDSFLMALIDNSISTIPTDSIIIDDYLMSIRYIEGHDAGVIGYEDFNALYEVLNTGSEPLEPIKDKKYRQTSFDEPHYYIKGFVYKAALVERIDEMMDSLSAFLDDESQFVSVRALAGMYYADYVMPYEFLREQIASLTFKLALARGGFASFASFVNIEGFMLFKDKKLVEIENTVQKTFDLTYFFEYAMKYLQEDLTEIFDDLASSQKEGVAYEAKNVGLSNQEKDQIKREAEPENAAGPSPLGESLSPSATLLSPAPMTIPSAPSPINQAPSGAANNQIYGQPDVALPIFPSALNDEDVQKIAVDLMETYPSLRKSQAHFYASHCTVGRSYTIQEFKKCEDTSYETARTSMDYLSSLGFYEKAKVRNKFVYKPIPRRK
jgi:hypothetical protein